MDALKIYKSKQGSNSMYGIFYALKRIHTHIYLCVYIYIHIIYVYLDMYYTISRKIHKTMVSERYSQFNIFNCISF